MADQTTDPAVALSRRAHAKVCACGYAGELRQIERIADVLAVLPEVIREDSPAGDAVRNLLGLNLETGWHERNPNSLRSSWLVGTEWWQAP